MLRKCLRLLAVVLFVGTAGPVATSVIAQFFVQAAQDKGYYEGAGQRLDAAMTAFSGFVFQTWFLCLASASAGLAAGLWLDAFLKRRSPLTASPHLYLGRVQVRLKLVSNGAIGFYFIGLNNAATPLAIKGVRGWIDYCNFSRGPSSSFTRLSDPQLAENHPKEIAPGAEFTIVVFYELPQSEADALQGLIVRDKAEVPSRRLLENVGGASGVMTVLAQAAGSIALPDVG